MGLVHFIGRLKYMQQERYLFLLHYQQSPLVALIQVLKKLPVKSFDNLNNISIVGSLIGYWKSEIMSGFG